MTMATGTEHPVWVDGPTGPLFGVLHRPVGYVDAPVCIIMLNSGMQNRSGPERLYVNVARQFAAAGITVLRADLSGCGDSPSANLETHFDSHRVGDVEALLKYVVETLGPGTLLLQGLCAGARVAFKAAARNDAVDGVLAWSTTIHTAGRNMPQSPEALRDDLSETVVLENRKRLWRFVLRVKFLNPVWWRKRLVGDRRLRDDAHEISRSVIKVLQRNSSDRNLSTFQAAANRYLGSGRRALFLYGERDGLSLKEFLDTYPDIGRRLADRQSCAVLDNGTHTFASRDVQEAVTRLCLDWVRLHYLETALQTTPIENPLPAAFTPQEIPGT